MKSSAINSAITFGVIVAVAVVDAVAPVHAADRGYAIYAERERMDQGYRDQQVDMAMVLFDRNGRTARRELSLTEAEGRGGGDQTLVVFSAPHDIADTALLTHEVSDSGDDHQWLYLPAYKSTRRIAGGGRRGRFVGTEFSYEDLAGDQLEDFDYRYIRQDEVGGRSAHLIERIPTNPSSAYSRQRTWVDNDTRQLLRAELFDRKGRHVKTLEAGDWRLYQGHYWRPHRLRMTHLESGRWTEMTTSGYRIGTGVRKRMFRPTALGR